MTAELRFGYELTVNRKRVRRIMRRLGLQGLPVLKPKRRGPDTEGAAADDLVLRLLQREAPDELRLTDITEHPTRDGKLYCCVALATYSRRVVGWSIDKQQSVSLVTSALRMAINTRKPPDGAAVHSDHGSQGGFEWPNLSAPLRFSDPYRDFDFRFRQLILEHPVDEANSSTALPFHYMFIATDTRQQMPTHGVYHQAFQPTQNPPSL